MDISSSKDSVSLSFFRLDKNYGPRDYDTSNKVLPNSQPKQSNDNVCIKPISNSVTLVQDGKSYKPVKIVDVTISEVRLKTLMKEMFKEEFEKQQKNLLNLISGNFDITMTEIKKVQSDINELKASLEHTETVLEEKVAKAEKKVAKLQEQINELWDYQVDSERLEFTERKIVKLKDRSRRNNLRIDGITEK